MRRVSQTLISLAALTVIAGCQKIILKPEGELPKALVVPTPAKVAVVVTPETANYTHKEQRASVDYEAQLGPGHKHLVEQIFRDVRMGKFHPGNTFLAHEVIGKLCLGVNPDDKQRWG